MTDLLEVEEDHLWPTLRTRTSYLTASPSAPEIIETFPDRAAVPRETWQRLTEGAERQIDILVFSGTFLAQTNPQLPKLLAKQANAGTRVRLCFGDPDGSAVALRESEEGIRGSLGPKIRASLSYFVDLPNIESCEIRFHNCTLYASIFRYDDEMLVNPHIWGSPASANPILRVRDIGEGGMFSRYDDSFTRVWDLSKSWPLG